MNILLNLLPEERKEILKQNVRSRFVLSQMFFYFFLELFYLAILMGAFFVVKFEQQSFVSETESGAEQSDRKKISEIEKSFRETNERTSFVLTMQSEHLRWTKFLLLLQEKFPDGVALSSLSTQDYKVILSGEADIRDHLLLFESRLKSEHCFENVNVPIANLVSKEDVSFQINFDLKKECIREKL